MVGWAGVCGVDRSVSEGGRVVGCEVRKGGWRIMGEWTAPLTTRTLTPILTVILRVILTLHPQP